MLYVCMQHHNLFFVCFFQLDVLMQPLITYAIIIIQSFRAKDFRVILNLLSISVPSTPWFTDILLYFCTLQVHLMTQSILTASSHQSKMSLSNFVNTGPNIKYSPIKTWEGGHHFVSVLCSQTHKKSRNNKYHIVLAAASQSREDKMTVEANDVRAVLRPDVETATNRPVTHAARGVLVCKRRFTHTRLLKDSGKYHHAELRDEAR